MFHKVFVLVILLASALPHGDPHRQPGDCPASLAETGGEIGYRSLTSNGQLVYTVERSVDDSAYHALYSLSLDGSAPPVLLYDNRANGHLALGVFSLSPDGEYVAFLPDPTQALVVPVDGGDPVASIALRPGETFAHVPDFSPDGRYLTAVAQNSGALLSLYRAPFPGGELELLTDRIARPWLLPAGDSVVFVGRADDGAHRIYRFQYDTRALIDLSGDLDVERLLISNIPLVFQVAGERLIFEASGDGNANDLYAISLDGGEPILLHSAPYGTSTEVAPSPDGRYLAFEQQGKLYTVPVDGSAPAVFIANVDPAPYLQFTPDGQSVTYVSFEADAGGVLFRAPRAGGASTPYRSDYPVSKNYRMQQVGDYLLISDALPGSEQYRVYIAPESGDEPLAVLFESIWDYRYGPFFFVREDGASIVFRRYDGETTSIYRAQAGEVFDPVQVGCTLPGHVRLIGMTGDVVIYTSEDRAIFAAPLD